MRERSEAPPAAERFPAAPARRTVPAILVAVIGSALTILTWTRALEERRLAVSDVLGSLADEVTADIESQLEREVDAVRGLATFWQLHGLLPEQAWDFDTRLAIRSFPGLRWVAWVPADSTRTRAVVRDTTVRIDPSALRLAREQRAAPTHVIQERWSDAYELEMLLPVGSPGESVSVLAASIRLDSLWFRKHAPAADNVSLSLRSDKGDRVVLRSASVQSPPWMKLHRTFTSPAGSVVQAELLPWPDFVEEIATPWPHFFLMTGLFLSVSLGLFLFQFMRARDYALGLVGANRELDERIAELSRRDRELRELNELLEKRVQDRTAQLTAALRELEAFSQTASHDLRSPICAILNYAEVLQDDFAPRLTPEERHLVERIQGAGQRANRLLGTLMEFAATGAGALQPEWVDVPSIAQSAYHDAVAGEPGGADVRFEAGALPRAFADAGAVHRVFANLFGNALKYSRGRALRVIEVGGSLLGGESVYWVRDNGNGFDPRHAADIFEPFRRLNGDAAEGNGLGLAIVAKLVRRLGGRVWAQSDGVSGATFSFTLPAIEARMGAEPIGAAV